MQLILIEPKLAHRPGADNAAAVVQLIVEKRFDAEDILLLPERFHLGNSPDQYRQEVTHIAVRAGCHVIGGSQHAEVDGHLVNTGLVVGPSGETLLSYTKLRPYGAEQHVVEAGLEPGECVIAGRRLLILICADFWFSDLFSRARELPDLILVPALSVTRKPTPEYSRALWRHLAIARAYEFGAYVGISDWSHLSELPALFAAGVGGFADPTAIEPDRLFRPIGPQGIATIPLDFATLDAFRRDRALRGFFWKPVP
jgi:predicted amidohydrolase